MSPMARTQDYQFAITHQYVTRDRRRVDRDIDYAYTYQEAIDKLLKLGAREHSIKNIYN